MQRTSPSPWSVLPPRCFESPRLRTLPTLSSYLLFCVRDTQPTQSSEVEAEEVPVVDDTKESLEDSSDGDAAKKEGDGVTAEPTVDEALQDLKGGGKTQGNVKTEFEFTPTAPAWTPGGVATEVVQEQSPPQVSPAAVPPDENAEAVPQEVGCAVADHVPEKPVIPVSDTDP